MYTITQRCMFGSTNTLISAAPWREQEEMVQEAFEVIIFSIFGNNFVNRHFACITAAYTRILWANIYLIKTTQVWVQTTFTHYHVLSSIRMRSVLTCWGLGASGKGSLWTPTISTTLCWTTGASQNVSWTQAARAFVDFSQWPLLICSNVRQKKEPPPLTQRQISADINSVQRSGTRDELGDSCRARSFSLTNWAGELTSLQFSEASQPPSSL